MADPLTSISPDEALADSPPPPPPPPPHHSRQQRKGGVTKAWLVVDTDGTSSVQHFGKHAIMRLTGLPGRDLRILDPMLSYPSTVLGRERAIVVKLEQIKAIITASEVLVLNYKDPLVASFVRDLQLRVAAFPNDSSTGKAQGIDGAELKDVTQSSNHLSPLNGCSIEPPVMEIPPQTGSSTPDLKDKSGRHMNDAPKEGNPRLLPFEFRALESCLEFACRCLESEALTLEKEAYPALDELTSKISTLNLERVRQIKSRLVAISGRVQKVRDELEQLLDDDMDMAEMYLTDKLNLRQAEVASSMNEIDVHQVELNEEGDDNSSYNSRGSNENMTFIPNIEELEMLLEAYFVQIEGILNKLSALKEYVDDTEDYINIMLDDKQNQLLQMGVMLSTATLIISAGIAAVGLMGMNIHISLYEAARSRKFLETVIGCVVSCILLFLTSVAWGKKRGLLS